MKPAELLEIVHRHYPRGLWPDDPRYGATEECRCLVEARIQAGTGAEYDRWLALLGRLEARFPEGIVYNRAFYLASGNHDAAYAAKVVLPGPEDEERSVAFMVSFLAPYYRIYGVRVALRKHEDAHEIRHDLSPEEESYARGIAQEIEAEYEYERLPPEIGNMLVPDVTPGNREAGKGTIYDCIFSDNLFFATLR
jgi:hypothetical protein